MIYLIAFIYIIEVKLKTIRLSLIHLLKTITLMSLRSKVEMVNIYNIYSVLITK